MKSADNVLSRGKTPAGTVLLLAWPIVLEQLMMTLVSYVDTAMVGSLGANATAAVAINSSIVGLINGIMMSLGIGFTALVARNIGAANTQSAKRVVAQALVVTFTVGGFLTAVMMLLSRQIPVWMGGEAAILQDAGVYLLIISMTMLFKAGSVLFTSILRGVGDTTTPMKVNLLVNLINVVGNILLIYETRPITLGGWTFTMWGAGWGVLGAAVATSLSIAVGGVLIMLVAFMKDTPIKMHREDDFRPDFTILRMVARISVPAAGEQLAMSFGQIAQTYLVTSLGTVALASHHLASTAESICFMPAFGFSAAVTTLVGQSLGAKEEQKAEQFSRVTIRMAVCFMTLMGVCLFVFSRQLMTIFTQDPVVVGLGMGCLKIVAISQPFFAVGMTVTGTLRGAGDTKWPFIITFLSMWGIRIICSAIAIKVFGAGLYSVWIFMTLDQMLRCLLFTLRFRSGRWKHILLDVQVAPAKS